MASSDQNGAALQFAFERLRVERRWCLRQSLVLAAVSGGGTGNELQHASEELRADKEVVLAAVNVALQGDMLASFYCKAFLESKGGSLAAGL
jgi:hypothetical protein